MILHFEMLELWFVLIRIFIKLGGSYWVTNLIKFHSFLLNGRRDEALRSMFATSLLVFFRQTDLSARSSKCEHIKKEFEVSTVNDLSGMKVEKRCTYRLQEISTILIWIEFWSHNICCYCNNDSVQTIRTSIELSAFRTDN